LITFKLLSTYDPST